MKLSIVTETFPPEINGVSLTFGNLARRLAVRGHTVTVIRPNRPDLSAASASEPYEQIVVPGLPIPGYPQLRFGLPARRRLSELWQENRPDLVHVVTEGPLGATAVSAARELQIPVSSSFHTNFHAYMREYNQGWLGGIVLAWLRRVHNRTQLTLAPTVELCRELAAEGFQNLGVFSRGVDLEVFHPRHRSLDLRRKWGADEETPVVLHVGRLAPEKNYPLLFETYRAMKRANPRCVFVLVGDGPLRESLAKEHPDYLFEGAVSGRDIGRCYASADVYVHASRSETFGNVLTEALASGLAVAGFEYAAARQFVRHGESGLLAPLAQPERLVAEAERLAADETLRALLRKGAPAAVAAQCWERVVADLEMEFQRIAAGTPRPPGTL